jgi:hypothetical protein
MQLALSHFLWLYDIMLRSMFRDEMDYRTSFYPLRYCNTAYRDTSYLSLLLRTLPRTPLRTLLVTSLPFPPHQPPRHPNHPHSTHQQPNTRRITNPILRSKPRLIHLRPHNPHQLRTRVRNPNRKTRRGSSMRCADSLWPQHRIDARGAGDGDADD